MSLEKDTLISGVEYQVRKTLDFLLYEHVKKLRDKEKVEGSPNDLAIQILWDMIMDIPVKDVPEGVAVQDHVKAYYRHKETQCLVDLSSQEPSSDSCSPPSTETPSD